GTWYARAHQWRRTRAREATRGQAAGRTSAHSLSPCLLVSLSPCLLPPPQPVPHRHLGGGGDRDVRLPDTCAEPADAVRQGVVPVDGGVIPLHHLPPVLV